MENEIDKSLPSKQQKTHPAIEYFRQLQRQSSTPALKEFLLSFNEPKSISYENFVEGVKRFIEIANSNSLGKAVNRKTFYGAIYSGLHYHVGLVELWNALHLGQEPIKASVALTLAHSEWDYGFNKGEYPTLIYKGQLPAQALDELLKGPTVIDCGMFTQLSLWFGIRYMLGNERFNQCFGRAPFFITRFVYNSIKESSTPFLASPLHLFLSKKEMATTPSVTVRHLSNTPLYGLKHPGGTSSGQNCIVIDDQYYIFAPHLESTQGMTEAAVLHLLRDAFNQGRTSHDDDCLAFCAKNSEKIDFKRLLTYGELIAEAEKLRDKTFSEEEFSQVQQYPECELTFDLHKFSTWLRRVESTIQPDSIDYLPLPIDDSLISTELLDVIPFENRTSMDFSKFKQETPQQKDLIIMSKQFCQSIMAHESKLVILTGKAGVGKTASAVCAAKELITRGKGIVWISEVMVNGWAKQAKSIADLDNCGLEIDNLLASDPDVVFLDDDNLAGFSGNLLLEKIYSWFVSNPGKGLFITSNEPIRFKDCYGYRLDGKYYYPPFNDYSSPQYLNWQHKADLAGMSLRSKHDGQSIGAVVSDLSWNNNKGNLRQFELIPGFDSDALPPITQNLEKTGSMECSAYDKLSPVQKKWIREYKGEYYYGGGGHRKFHVAITKNFEKTTCKTIALEMIEYNSPFSGKQIDSFSMNQLIYVLNYAHDQGGRRIILINQTSYSTEQLLIQIKAQLPTSESERSWSRLELLLCETEDTIFSRDQYNGHIDVAPPKRFLPEERSHGFHGLLMRNRRLKDSTRNKDVIFGATLEDPELLSILSKFQLSFFGPEKPFYRRTRVRLPIELPARLLNCYGEKK